MQIPNLHDLVLAAGKKRIGVLPDQSADRRMMSTGLGDQDRLLMEVADVGLRLGRTCPQEAGITREERRSISGRRASVVPAVDVALAV